MIRYWSDIALHVLFGIFYLHVQIWYTLANLEDEMNRNNNIHQSAKTIKPPV